MIVGNGTIVGKYRLEKLLARGGMGSVWIALHEQLDSRVALKFMDAALATSADARQRFEREAKAAAKLRSPHVVQVFDYGVEGDTAYIAMELLEGESFAARLQRAGRLSLGEASIILTQCCKALRLAHDAGIIHRDLKPGNIFLARSGDDEVVKILDFGIAKATKRSAADESTKSGTVLGSPHYMSPEQARGSEVDHRTDLWSMGVILFRAVTGVKPFVGDAMVDVLVRICTDPIPVPTSVAPGLSPEVDAFFERALARDREKRFQSARSMADAFAELAGQQSMQTAPSAVLARLESADARDAVPSDDPSGPRTVAEVRSGSAGARRDETKSLPRPMPAATAETPPSSLGATLTLATTTTGEAPPAARSPRARWVAVGVGVLGAGLAITLGLSRTHVESASKEAVSSVVAPAGDRPTAPAAPGPSVIAGTAATPPIDTPEQAHANGARASESSAADVPAPSSTAKSSAKTPRFAPVSKHPPSTPAAPPPSKAGPNPVLGI